MARRNASSRVVVAVVATASLFAVGLGTASSAPHVARTLATTPTLKVRISHGKFTLHGPRSFQAGRVDLSLTARGKESEIEVAQFAKGYGFKGYIRNFKKYAHGQTQNGESKAGLAALNHLVDNTTFFGGLDSPRGKTTTGSILLPTAGTYVIFNDSAGRSPHKLTVTGPAVKRAAPKSSGTIKANSRKRFGGAVTASANGTLTYRNVSKGSGSSPHFLVLQHVAKGTTRRQVFDALMSSSNSKPAFARAGSLSIDVISPGHSMTFDTHLPKGEYAEMCFFPDLQTGVPHAFMGMVGIITLK